METETSSTHKMIDMVSESTNNQTPLPTFLKPYPNLKQTRRLWETEFIEGLMQRQSDNKPVG